MAALLTSFEQPPQTAEPGCRTSQDIADSLSDHGVWEDQFHVVVQDLEGHIYLPVLVPYSRKLPDIAHTLLDLMIQGMQNSSANTSPSTPSSPHPHSSSRNIHAHAAQLPPAPYNADQLIRLKIAMREHEHTPRVRQPLGNADPTAVYAGEDSSTFGRNEGTVRFLFAPQGVVEQGLVSD